MNIYQLVDLHMVRLHNLFYYNRINFETYQKLLSEAIALLPEKK
jgi:hypothetical protein